MMTDVDVFSTSVRHRILRKCNCTLIVGEEIGGEFVVRVVRVAELRQKCSNPLQFLRRLCESISRPDEGNRRGAKKTDDGVEGDGQNFSVSRRKVEQGEKPQH